MSEKLTDLKTRMARILDLGGWRDDRSYLFAIVNEAYWIGRNSSLQELSEALHQTPAEEVIVNAFALGREVGREVGREERDAELAEELTGGSSILRDPIVVDNPAGDAWLEGD